MTQTLIEKLKALPTCDVTNDGEEIWRDKNGRYVHYYDLRAIIEDAKAEKQETEAHNGYIEGTAERLRLICSKLGIGAPVSNEEIMFCQFSLLGAIRRKIDAIYTTPQPDIVAELVKALEDVREDVVECLNYDLPNKGWERYDKRIAQREEQIKTIDALIAKSKEMMG